MILDICNNSNTLMVIYIIKTIIEIICHITPVLIIIFSTISISKTIMSNGNIDKSLVTDSIKRLVAGIIIFLIPSLINFLFTNVIDANGNEILSCIESSSIEKIEQLREKENQEKARQKEQEQKENEKILEEYEKKQAEKNEAIKKSNEKINENIQINNNGIDSNSFNNKLNSMKTPTISEIQNAASQNGISNEYLIIIIGTTQREGYVNDPYLYYGWASAMINNQVSLSQMQGWDPYHSGDSNYYSQANINNGYNNASDAVLKAVYLALTERNTKIVECNGMYSTTPSSYNLLYKSSVYNCSIYERK